MKKTIVITGASSGIGKATALYFAHRNWNVAATMRKPENAAKDLVQHSNIRLYRLDVTETASIDEALHTIIQDFGAVDAIVNNAGYGAVGVFEAATPEQIQQQFDTNVFGVMNVMRAILPYFRQRRQGTILNVTSMGGQITFPLYSVYHSTKWAVEGLSESMSFELNHHNIRMKIIEPGAIKTDFYDRSMDLFSKQGLHDYDHYTEITYKNTQEAGNNAPGPDIVAKAIFKAANDTSKKLRYPVGSNAPLLLLARKILPLRLFMTIIGSVVEKGLTRQR